MQDFGQRVARTEFCPDAMGESKQIQIKCCRRAALARRKVPNWNKLKFLMTCPYDLGVFWAQNRDPPSAHVRGHAFCGIRAAPAVLPQPALFRSPPTSPRAAIP